MVANLTVSRAPLSFFSETETGVLINRFSQDLRHVDMSLPGAVINVAFRKLSKAQPKTARGQLLTSDTELGNCIGSVALSVNAVGYFAVILPFILLVLYAVQNFYLRTSRQLRLLE